MSAYFLRVTAVVIATLICTVFLKSYKPELSLAVAISGSVIAVLMILNGFKPYVDDIKALFFKTSFEPELLKTVLKAVGISYISAFAADTCRDCGQTALALKAELAGKCAVFVLCVPMIIMLLKTALEVAKG